MPQLLLELFSEEIPARMQAQAADDLKRLMLRALSDRGLAAIDARAYVTPRRLALVVDDLPAASADVNEELKGPRTSAPAAALDGFLKKTGLTKDQLTVQADPKGDFYLAKISKKGAPAAELIAEAIADVVRNFPWPKSMKWEPSGLQWVRPIRSILCLFDGAIVPLEIAGLTSGNTTRGHRQMANEPFEVKDFADYDLKLRERRVILDRAERMRLIDEQAEVAAANAQLVFRDDDALLEEVAGLVELPVVLTGHFEEAFLAVPQEVLISTMRANQKYFALYQRGSTANPLSNPRHGEEGASAPVSNHAHGPHPASFETQPPAAPQDDENGAISNLRHGEEGARAPVSNHAESQTHALPLANAFLIVSNLEARDGGRAIVAGNEKVIRARLSDAKFFWEQDLKETLEDRLPKLKDIVFHAKLGTQWDRVQRIERLAEQIAMAIGADPLEAAQAARLCKADLVSGTVGEFPEVQGIIGGYLARAEGLSPAVADAIADHYRPQGPSDRVPTAPVSIAVALADKLDTLVGLMRAGVLPTGSKDPFALRRAALGIVRAILENGLRFDLFDLIYTTKEGLIEPELQRLRSDLRKRFVQNELAALDYIAESSVLKPGRESYRFWEVMEAKAKSQPQPMLPEHIDQIVEASISEASRYEYQTPGFDREVFSFFLERLRIVLLDRGMSHSLLTAVASEDLQAVSEQKDAKGQQRHVLDVTSRANGDLVLLVRRVEALQSFLATDDGKNLLAGYKRAANILRIEEKKDKTTYAGTVDPAKLTLAEERALFAAIEAAEPRITAAIASEDFAAAMTALANLRASTDAFFEKVKVNDDDASVRINRLNLLARIKSAAHLVADFSKIEG